MKVELIYLKNIYEGEELTDTEEVYREIQEVEDISEIEIRTDIDYTFIDIFDAEEKEYVKSILKEEGIGGDMKRIYNDFQMVKDKVNKEIKDREFDSCEDAVDEIIALIEKEGYEVWDITDAETQFYSPDFKEGIYLQEITFRKKGNDKIDIYVGVAIDFYHYGASGRMTSHYVRTLNENDEEIYYDGEDFIREVIWNEYIYTKKDCRENRPFG